MDMKLVLTEVSEKQLAVLVQEGRVLEICPKPRKARPLSGEVYIGTVKKVIPAKDAAFVEIAGGIPCFLSLKGRTVKAGSFFPVQIVKEASGMKRASATGEVSLSGKYVVVSFREGRGSFVQFSSKLSGEEKERLKGFMADAALPAFRRVVLRTAAREAGKTEILSEVRELSGTLAAILDMSGSCGYGKSGNGGGRVFPAKDEAFYRGFIRKHAFGKDMEIVTDDEDIYRELEEDMELPESCRVRFYPDKSPSLASLYGLSACVEGLRCEKVWLKDGGFLIIQRTEAFHVIDVNSGKHISGKDREEAIYETNLCAAREIAVQIRLRNLSGVILVDFINMKDQELKKRYLDGFADLLAEDPVRTRLVDETALQIVEITRKRTSPPTEELLYGEDNRRGGR